MPKPLSPAVMALAEQGAKVRYRQLQEEQKELLELFPNLNGTNGIAIPPPSRVQSEQQSRPALSAAQKAQISKRMKAYWASRRKTAKATP